MNRSYRRKEERKADVDTRQSWEVFERAGLGELMRTKEAQENYDIFTEVYKTVVTRFVPKCRPGEWEKEAWFNTRCVKNKENRGKAWKRLKKNKNNRNKAFELARNEYVIIRKEEEKM